MSLDSVHCSSLGVISNVRHIVRATDVSLFPASSTTSPTKSHADLTFDHLPGMHLMMGE